MTKMGDIEATPTAASKSDVRVRNDSHDSPATEVGGVTVTMELMNMSSSEQKANTATEKPVWAGPKQEQSVAGSNPFVAQHMSATADAFKPSFYNGMSFISPSQDVNVSNYSVAPDCAYQQQEIKRPLIVHSTPPSTRSVNGKQPAISSGSNAEVTATFSTDKGFQMRHFVKIDNVSTGDFERIKKDDKILFHKALASENHEGMLSVYVCFDDIRDSHKYCERNAAAPVKWVAQTIPDGLFKEKLGGGTIVPHHGMSRYDGQVLFVAKFSRHQDSSPRAEAPYKPHEVVELVTKLAAHFGEVLAFQPYPQSHGQGYRVEYFKISAAEEAVRHLRKGENIPHFHRGWEVDAASFIEKITGAVADDVRDIITSPTGRTAWSYDKNGNCRAEKPARTIPKVDPNSSPSSDELVTWSPTRARGNWSSLPMPTTAPAYDGSVVQRSSSYPTANNSMVRFAADSRETQEVHIDRIASGQDVRTTIMMRNVPNAYGADDIRARLNSTSFGKYDFSYLRIDFQKDQNVGYGFVNFIEAEAIIPFCQQYQNTFWPPAMHPVVGEVQKPRKVQISYATIQGVDCLVEKFRNSAVMDECPGYRPKVWFAETDVVENGLDQSLVGTEKVFPPPNNLSKHKRSAENAGQIGLFQPNSRGGDRFRGGDRGRRSQYDRGTTRQMVEDASYYAYAAGPAYNAMAPIGTPAAFPQQGGYQPVGPQYYNGYPQVDAAGYMAQYQYAQQYQHGQQYQQAQQYQQGQYPTQFTGQYQAQAQYPAAFAGGQHGYAAANTGYGAQFATPNHAGQGYQVNNRASQLRTMTNGRLASRPRANVTVSDPSRFDPAPGVPRSIVAHNGEYPPASAEQYYAANNGYAGGQAAVNGNQYQYSQY